MRVVAPIAIASVFAAGIVYYGLHRAPAAARIASPRPPTPVEPASEADRAVAPSHRMVPPIQGLRTSDLVDTFNSSRGNGTRKHEATDILASRGTPVQAMVDGVIQKLFLSAPGGNTIYEFDDAGEYCYYYAHLDRYAEGLAQGQRVRAGDLIGYVGSTGNADPNTPHLHLAIFELGPEKRWWEGTPINPYPILLRLAQPG